MTEFHRYIVIFNFVAFLGFNKQFSSELGYNQNKRHRCVTLNGELIELTGAMSGGGKPK